MSMMMPPDPNAGGGMPMPPGGGMPPDMGGAPVPPMDAMSNAGPLPAEGGMAGLAGALGGMPPEPGMEEALAPPDEAGMQEDMSDSDHIRQAMIHLIMALTKSGDDERGAGIVKGMGALQGLLGAEQKAATP